MNSKKNQTQLVGLRNPSVQGVTIRTWTGTIATYQQWRPATVALLIMQVLICVAKRLAGMCLIWTLQEWNRIRFPRCKKEALVLYF